MIKKMITNRANVICILDILREYSDEEHILSMREIISKMKVLYDATIDRRTVYSAMSVLKEDLGYEISVYDENKQGYYLKERIMESSEIRVLMDSVYACDGIPQRLSEMLIEKLQKFLSCHQRKQYRNLKIVRKEKRTPNKSVFLTIDMLDEAISQKVQVEFTYLHYNLEKKLIPKRNLRYFVNPYALVFANGHYYLACTYDGYEDISYYRVDKICDVKILDTEVVKLFKTDSDLKAFNQKHVYMFTPGVSSVKIRCHNVVLDDVIEEFGKDIALQVDDQEHFIVTLKHSPGGLTFWLLQYLQYCEVIEPKQLRKEIVQIIQENKYNEAKNV